MLSSVLEFLRQRPWAMELLAAVLCLLFGMTLMPVLIFYAGVVSLGRYDGASLERLYGTLLDGFRDGSLAPWVVVLGPYALYLLFRGLRAWWRLSARLA